MIVINKNYNFGIEKYIDNYYIECVAEYTSSYRCMLYNVNGYNTG